jgi:hypothetical protein
MVRGSDPWASAQSRHDRTQDAGNVSEKRTAGLPASDPAKAVGQAVELG